MRKCLLILASLGFFTAGKAQWNTDSTSNNPILLQTDKDFTASATVSGLVTTTDGANGAWLAWLDSRNSTSLADVYVQHISSTGNILLAAKGVPLCTATGAQASLSISADAAGGAIVAWQDPRNGNNDIYAQRIKADGTIGWAENGIAIENSAFAQVAPVVSLVSLTEFVVAWRDDRNDLTVTTLDQDIYAQKFLISDGTEQWTSDTKVVSQNQTQTQHQLLPNLSGGFFICWADPRTSSSQSAIYVQNVNGSGVPQWNVANDGVEVAFATNNRTNPQMTYDGAGGLVLTWQDLRTGNTDGNILAQRVSSAGALAWLSPLVLCSATATQASPAITKSGSFFFVAWQDPRTTATTGTDIYAQSFDVDGTIRWQTDGVLVSGKAGSQFRNAMQLWPDGSGGIIIVNDDSYLGTSDIQIYGHRLNSSGVKIWPENGAPIATKTGSNQNNPVSILSSDNSVIVMWLDGRTASNTEIYGSRLTIDGSLPMSLLSFTGNKRAAGIDLTWETSNELNTREYLVEKSSDALNFGTIGSLLALNRAGNHSYLLTDAKPLNGNNFYRLKMMDADGKFSYSSILRFSNSNRMALTTALYPNPAKTSVQLQLSNFDAGNYQARLLDLNGKLVSRSTIAVKLSFEQITLPISGLASGSYLLQVLDANGMVVAANKLMKL